MFEGGVAEVDSASKREESSAPEILWSVAMEVIMQDDAPINWGIVELAMRSSSR
jgi:hypothetical protein